MIHSKLIHLLKTLDTRERNRFQQYVHSPFFNKHAQIRLLADYLLEQAPAYSAEYLAKQTVGTAIFGQPNFNEDQLNNLISDLLHLLYGFLAYKQYEQDPQLEKQLLIQELFAKDNYLHVERVTRRYQQLQQKAKEQSYAFYLKGYHLHEALDQLELSKNQRRFNQHLQQQSDQLDVYYFINKLRLACDMSSRNTVIQATYHCHFLDQILAFCQQQPDLLKTPVLRIYFQTLQMLENRENPKFYYQLKEALKEHSVFFPNEELRTLYNYVLNYCIQKINSGNNDFYQETLELYQTMLDAEIIFVNGYLTQWSYKNIITTGIRLHAYEWTEQFIYTYKTRLLPEEQANAFCYNLAALYYAKAEYSKALLQLQDVEFTDPSYHLGAKIIQLKSYYELNEEEPFFALIEAFKKYLNRNRQISDYRKRANLHFLKLAKLIFKLKSNEAYLTKKQRQAKKLQIIQKLKSWEPIANKRWLEINIE